MNALALTVIASAAIACSAHAAPNCNEPEAHRIGLVVIEVERALTSGDKKVALETIVKHGTDSRHYEMIRGWLVQRLKSTEGQLEATRGNPERERELTKSVEFLRQVIRRIDLE